MIIADNQAPGPHRRNASGDPQLNRSPVAYFLRAAGAAASPVPAETEMQLSETSQDPELFPQEDEDTGNLKEPFNDEGEATE